MKTSSQHEESHQLVSIEEVRSYILLIIYTDAKCTNGP